MKGYNGVLVFVEHDGKEIHRVSYELINKGLEISKKSNSPLYCLILGGENLKLEELCYRGAEKVFCIKGKCFEKPEEYLFKENVVEFIKEYKIETVLIGATNFGRSLAPRIAAALKTGLTADCTDLKIDKDGKIVQIRPAFSNNIFAHIKTTTLPQMATIRYKEFEEAKIDENRKVNIETLKSFRVENKNVEITQIYKEENLDITQAQVIVAGGRGIKKKEDLSILSELAGMLGGELGASRALVDSGMISSAHQIGYSGNRVKPKVYIACGISGAPQHIAGMKESDLIIAVNSDPSAPIFRIADYGYIGNLYDVIPKMIEALKTYK